MRFQMVPQADGGGALQMDFLDLPWDQPLIEWQHERLVQVARGIHRHVVRFVSYEDRLYALKELPPRLAEREYRLLRQMATDNIPVVEVVGFVADRIEADTGDPLEAVLITRHLEFSLPYRALFMGHGIPDLRNRLLDALAGLLVRLHMNDYFWGDCSLSNTLFRRDAGELASYLVDAETAEYHVPLSDGLRRFDINIAEENVAGELLDIQASGASVDDPIAIARDLRQRYEALWNELTGERVFGTDERFQIEARLRRLNDMGFDVDEYELATVPEGFRLRLNPRVVEPGHHRRRLFSMTGLSVQENQARRLLQDIEHFAGKIEEAEGRRPPPAVLAYRWLAERFEPAIAAIPGHQTGKLEPAEIFHQIIEHRWYLSEQAGRDVGLDEAIEVYISQVLPEVPEERKLFTDDDELSVSALPRSDVER
jgi:Domain of unknown function (DUF4032)/Lipopolysaccharide kinase (Kdo/WaaP) family